jgi:co-chaperonin GroES (HSP10)
MFCSLLGLESRNWTERDEGRCTGSGKRRKAGSSAKSERLTDTQFGGSPIKVGEEEYTLFRDHELLAKINE